MLFDAAWAWPAFVIPDALAVVQPVGTLRWASAAYMSASTDSPPDLLWEPRLLGDVEIGQMAVDALGIGGMLPVGLANIDLADADSALADLARWGVADGRPASIIVIPVIDGRASDFGTPLAGRDLGTKMDMLTGLPAPARTDPILAFSGITSRVERNADRTGTLRMTDVVERLSTPLQPLKYLGTGGLEGGDELKGKPKPVALGRVYNIDPVALGDIDLGVGIGALPTFQFHWREAQSVDAVRIRGVAQALVGGTPIVGQARGFPDRGLFQLGSTPDGSVRADVRGEAVGGYVSSTAGVIKRLVQTLGPQLGTDDVDPMSFTFAEADLPGEIGLWQGPEDISTSEATDRIVSGCGAILCGGRAGKLRLVDPLARDVDQFTLTAMHMIDCQPVSMPAALQPLPRAAAMGWRPNWAPIDDAASSVTAAERQKMRNPQSGPARSESAGVTKKVAQQRDLSFRGLYFAQADAAARAALWRNFLASGPRIFRVTTDRYLNQIETGHTGRITYPAWGLDNGVRVSVLGWIERIAARRLTLTVVTLPET